MAGLRALRSNEGATTALLVYTAGLICCDAATYKDPKKAPMTQTVTAPHGSEMLTHGNGEAGSSRTGFWPLTLGSIGVVYGDIGTSPLYALREAVNAAVGTGAAPPPAKLCSACFR